MRHVILRKISLLGMSSKRHDWNELQAVLNKKVNQSILDILRYLML